MADIPLYDESDEVPVPLARNEVRFISASVKPYSDGRRMKLNFRLTPFLERPSIDVAVTDSDGHEVAALSLIEAMDTEFDFTVHLRGPEPRGEHTLQLTLFYLENDEPGAARQVVDEHRLTFLPVAQGALG